MKYPIKGSLNKEFKITSPFGPRVHPITKKKTNHNGTDLVMKSGKTEGTPIIAPEAGKITVARKSTAPGGGYGYYIKMTGASGVEHLFAHMVKNSFKKRAGQVVAEGEVIGLIGNTGASTGPHLHWEVRVKGKFVDPIAWMDKGHEVKLPSNFKAWTKNNNNGTVSVHIKNAPRGSKVRVRHDGVSVFNQTVRLAKHAGLGKTVKLNVGRNRITVEVDGQEVAGSTYNFRGTITPPKPQKPVRNDSTAPKNDQKQEKFYIVKAGDTLTKIAREHKTTIATLKKINNIKNANLIKVGQVIKLP